MHCSIRIPFFPRMRILEGSLSMSCTKQHIKGGPRCFFSMSANVKSSSNIIPKEFPIVGSNMLYSKDKPRNNIVTFSMELSCCAAFCGFKPCVHLRMNNHVFRTWQGEISFDRNMIRSSMLGHNRDVGSSTENRDISTHYTVKKRVHRILA